METAVLLVVEELASYIDRWRRDSWASLEPPLRLTDAVPPHITLLWPWQPDPCDDEALGRVRSAAAAVAAFDLRFRRVAAFEDGAVFLEPDPSPGLDRLFGRLVDAFPEYPPYGGQYEKVRLHVTVSVGGGVELANEVAAAGIDVTVHVPSVSVGRVSAAGQWESLVEVPLGAGRLGG